MAERRVGRRDMLGALLALAAIGGGSGAMAQELPAQPIRIVVATAAGGITDIITRLIGPGLSERLGRPVVVDNRPGANGAIGSEAVARAAPDGTTLQMGFSASHVMNPLLRKTLPYAVEDFAPVTLVGRFPLVVMVNAALPGATLKDVVDQARAARAQLSYSSSGIGATPHLAGARFQQVTGLDMVHVPFQGEAPSLAEVAAGRVSAAFPTVAGALPHLQSGKARALAVMGTARSSLLPDLPTIAEAGMPGLEFGTWYGIFAPARTPAGIVARIDRETRAVLAEPAIAGKLRELGGDPTTMGPADFAAYLRSEIEKYGAIVRSTGVTLE